VYEICLHGRGGQGAVMAASILAQALVDINPLRALPDGCVALDAVVVLSHGSDLEQPMAAE
jgi:hypothetical protein